MNSSQHKSLSPQDFRQYVNKINVDLDKQLSFAEFRYIFLKLMNDYLNREIPLETFAFFVSYLDELPHDPEMPENQTLFTLEDLIEHATDQLSYHEIKKSEPTWELLKTSPPAKVAYPIDSTMNDLLIYFQNNLQYLIRA